MLTLASLNKPLTIGSLKLKNPVVMAPMSRNLSPNHTPNDAVASYYQRRAKGGVGLIITESSAIDHPAAQGARAHAGGVKCAPGFTKATSRAWHAVVDAVKIYGTPIFAQLWHVGSTREPLLTFNTDVPAYGPSAIKHPRFGPEENIIPQIMSKKDIADHIRAYAEAAILAEEIGFDGVELNAAHGYGIDQFFWSQTNQRQDEYGGETLAERARFAIEIIEAIKAATSSNFLVSIRISQWKMGAYDYKMATNMEELKAFIMALSKAGTDVFHVSTRDFQETFFNTGKTLAALVKEISNKPVIAVGSIATATDLIGSLRQGQAGHFSLENLLKSSAIIANKDIDFIAIGRPLIADPDWLQKIQANQFDQIIPFEKNMLQSLDGHLGESLT